MIRILLTGASSGIGNHLMLSLVRRGYYINGIGRNFDNTLFPSEERLNEYYLNRLDDNDSDILRNNLNLLSFDLGDINGLNNLVNTVYANGPINILINNAGVAYYGNHETIDLANIYEMVNTNLTVPMMLTKLVLPRMKNDGAGIIINISSVTAKGRSNTHGCAYGATKAGLSSFGDSLFEEARKSGIKVMNIHPDLTESNLYRNADFTTASGPDAHIDTSELAEIIADAIDEMCFNDINLNISDITIRPQRNRLRKKTQNPANPNS